MDNGSSEIIEVLHIPTCKVTYHVTNWRAYTTQILDQLQRVDSLSIYSSILEAKGINQSQIDQATKGLSPPCVDANVGLITVSKHPQSVGMAVNAASSKFSTPDLASAMLCMIVTWASDMVQIDTIMPVPCHSHHKLVQLISGMPLNFSAARGLVALYAD
ncbi:uncharacterized protein EI90DRAFT_3124589 [Cantharellus anzutake]|uniref:uncharacterized protein n=1 Tax=Cantharellus anzutake TaxID=1750568 RepID=UPI001903BB5A|nr:uncharacterized protein EI90DRAFT_3124589 [Cantharellus anzutake]KAF8330158.1 hypothetical protein EI90DRAFT_3124589 [Cantharellus anzutake]